MSFWGTLGVTIFFMISGFFSIKNLDNEEIKEKATKRLIKKIIRIWPTYFVCIILIFGATHLWYLPGRTVSMGDFIANIFLINRYFKLPYVDGAHWYLSVLVFYYIVLYSFELLGIQNKPYPYIIWILLEFCVDRIFVTGDIYPIGGPFVGCFCIGIAINCILNEKTSGIKKKLWKIVVFLSILTTFLIRGKICAFEIVVIIPVLYLCIKGRSQMLATKPLVFIGHSSYPLYLIHQNISFIVQNALVSLFGRYTLLCPLIALIFVIITGTLMYYYVEKPIYIKLNKFEH